MKKQFTLLSAAAGLLLAHGAIAQDVALEQRTTPLFTASFYGCSHTASGERNEGAKNGIGFIPKLQFRIPDSPFSLVAKGWYTKVEYEDNGIMTRGPYGLSASEMVCNQTQSVTGFSAEARYDFYSDNLVNVYLSAGIIYEQGEFEHDDIAVIYYYGEAIAADGEEGIKEKQDGTSGIAHLGIETFHGDWYLNAEVGVFGEIYEGDSASAELTGVVGYNVNKNWRIDGIVRYLSEFKETYAGVGITLQY